MKKSEEKSPSEAEVEARMRPGAFSRSGFLGTGERLKDVLDCDDRTLKKLKLTHAEIASKLDLLVTAAEKSPSHKALMDRLECQVQMHQGFQICPWAVDPYKTPCKTGLGASHTSLDWSIRDIKSGATMSGPGLAVHLIRDHQFFEGKASPYRLYPKKLAEFLGLA